MAESLLEVKKFNASLLYWLRSPSDIDGAPIKIKKLGSSGWVCKFDFLKKTRCGFWDILFIPTSKSLNFLNSIS